MERGSTREELPFMVDRIGLLRTATVINVAVPQHDLAPLAFIMTASSLCFGADAVYVSLCVPIFCPVEIPRHPDGSVEVGVT